MVELDPVVAYPWPAELRLLKSLGIKANTGSIPPDDLDPVRSFGPEDIKRTVERVTASVPHQRQQTVRSLAEVDRMAREEDLNA